jgi:hypothetical protein
MLCTSWCIGSPKKLNEVCDVELVCCRAQIHMARKKKAGLVAAIAMATAASSSGLSALVNCDSPW